MSKARTVPGENLSSRLAARSGRRVRAGARPSFYERLGVADPFADEPELEEMSRNGMFSYISASNYYRAIRSQRLRMMWRLQAIRHRPVTGERLRAAGPKFAQRSVLANAELPALDDLVLLDPEAKPEEDEPKMSRGLSSPAYEIAAARAAERSVSRPDAELTRALAQIETLLQSQSRESERQHVREIIREVPSMAPARRAEAVREVVRAVERAPVVESTTPMPRRELASAPVRAANRPAAVAANRIQIAEPSARTTLALQRRLAPMIEQGPTGLQPVLRTSPAIRAVGESAVARIAQRPELVGRPVVGEQRRTEPTVATRPSRLRPAEAIALTREQDQEELGPVRPEAPVAAPLQRPEAPRARERATAAPVHRAPSVTADRPRLRRSTPTGRVAEALVARTVAPPEDGTRGLPAGGRVRAIRSAGDAVPRAVVRGRAGSTESDIRAPLASSATSWLSDALHDERRVVRARRAVSPVVRTLGVADDLPLLDPTVEPGPTTDRSRAARGLDVQSPADPIVEPLEDLPAPPAPQLVRRSDDLDQPAPAPAARPEAAPLLPRTQRLARTADPVSTPQTREPARRRLTEPTTLRAAARSIVDTESLAPSPVRSISRIASSVSTTPTLLEPAAQDASDTEAAPRRIARRASSPTPAARPTDRTPEVPTAEPAAVTGRRTVAPQAPQVAPVASRRGTERPALRVARRARQADAAVAGEAFAPILRRTAPEVTDRPVRMRSAEVRATTRPAAIDLIALSHDHEEGVDEAVAPRETTRSASSDAVDVTPERRAESIDEVATRRENRALVVDDEPAPVPVRDRVRTSPDQRMLVPRIPMDELDLDEGAPATLRHRRAAPRRAPATRRALHRAAESEAIGAVDTGALLSAIPTSFVHAAPAQKALRAQDEEVAHAAVPGAREDRPTTRAMARAVPSARVDDFDRVRFTPPPTDYLDVAAAGEPITRRRIRRSIAAPMQATVLRQAEDDAVAPSVVRRAAAAAAADRSPALRSGSELDLATISDVAVRPGPARRARPVLPLEALVPVQHRGEDSVDAPVAERTRDLPELASTLRQVAASFRASERDGVQVLTVPSARRAIAPEQARTPTMTAVLERDDEGRVIRARGRRLTGARSGETVLLDPADLGVEPEGATVTPGSRIAARADDDTVLPPIYDTRAPAAASPSTILALPPAAWAEERIEAASDEPVAQPRTASTPVRRAGRRWRRPVPEGPVLQSTRRMPVAEQENRLTAQASRRRPIAPEALTLAPMFDDEEDESPDAVTRAARRSEPHGANTWTDLARRAEIAPMESGRPAMRVADDSPSWVRRAVDPHPVERDEREVLGSRIRSGSSGLLNALARASAPEEIVRVIVEKSSEAGALAKHLDGEAGRILSAIASDQDAHQLLAPVGSERERNKERSGPARSTLSRRERAQSLLAPSQGFSSSSPQSRPGDAHQGVGMSKVMKLASKLRKLIHLAENARLAEARSQVRLAEDSAEARHEAGAGRSGAQGIEDSNMHLEALRDEVMSHVQQRMELNKSRTEEGDDGWW